jgi:phosphatidylserine/phosphatidylglycerophosphate/cardiolipin synthase-like enzyme
MKRIDNVQVLKSNVEFINAAVELINQASRYIRIRSYILDPDLFDNAEVNAALSAFARKSRYSEVHILLDEPDRLLQFSHSTLNLIRRLSQKMIVKHYYDKPNEELETTIISDNRGILIKYPNEGEQGYFSLTDAIYTDDYREKFEHEWQQSSVAHHLRSFIL